MNYEEAVGYIHSLEVFGVRPGLERIRALCSLLGNPQDHLRFLHVAGTNGKGSASTMLASVLRAQGYRTGLFTSPYVVDFRERICVNGEMIPRDALAECTAQVKGCIDRLADAGEQVTEFEAITAIAFLYYYQIHCDFVVLEVGLGGRYDATNVIPAPLVSLLMSISLDHTAVLGDSVEQIAFEKCGILKSGSIAVSYPMQSEEALGVIRSRCAQEDVPLILPSLAELEVASMDASGSEFVYRGASYRLPLAGEHMIYNCITAIEALLSLRSTGVEISADAMTAGIAGVTMPARMELLRAEPPILLDGGHNEGCAAALRAFVQKNLAGKRITAVCSLMEDKDYVSYLQIVAPLAERIIATRAPVPRALSAESLAETAALYCGCVQATEDPEEAVRTAVDSLAPGDALLVCGSFYLAGAVRKQLLNL